ncbi:MAG: hypothetical protein KDC27_12280 [Acidobacteria bacterium]|nr:hypothetical protein [Acidobacteriota bacterium]
MRIFTTQLRSGLAVVLAGLMAAVAPVDLRAAEHVVPSDALTQRLEAGAAQRAADEAALRGLFGSEAARKTLAASGVNADEAVNGVAALSNEDLAKLADRARAYQADVAAGALTNQQITYILIALATAVIILVIVAAD